MLRQKALGASLLALACSSAHARLKPSGINDNPFAEPEPLPQGFSRPDDWVPDSTWDCLLGLHRTAAIGDEAGVAEELERGEAPDVVDKCGYHLRPLHLAVDGGFRPIVETLLAKGALTNVPTADKKVTPLMSAAGKGDLELVRALLRHKARPDARDLRNATALAMAAQFGHDAVVSALLEGGADPTAMTSTGITAWAMAAYFAYKDRPPAPDGMPPKATGHMKAAKLLGDADPQSGERMSVWLTGAVPAPKGMPADVVKAYESLVLGPYDFVRIRDSRRVRNSTVDDEGVDEHEGTPDNSLPTPMYAKRMGAAKGATRESRVFLWHEAEEDVWLVSDLARGDQGWMEVQQFLRAKTASANELDATRVLSWQLRLEKSETKGPQGAAEAEAEAGGAAEAWAPAPQLTLLRGAEGRRAYAQQLKEGFEQFRVEKAESGGTFEEKMRRVEAEMQEALDRELPPDEPGSDMEKKKAPLLRQDKIGEILGGQSSWAPRKRASSDREL